MMDIRPKSDLEIRKLSPIYVRKLEDILEPNESWKSLMKIIPKTLNKTSYKCDINENNLPKYHSEHFMLIENASSTNKITCTRILFDEWGTSGRVRPALGHLLYLLIRAELFRAADYVAEILNVDKPERPRDGPAALVTVELPVENCPRQDNIEEILDELDYPSSAIEEIYHMNENTNHRQPAPIVIPTLVVTPDSNEQQPVFHAPVGRERANSVSRKSNNINNKQQTVFHTPVVRERANSGSRRTSNVNKSVSDMINFPSTGTGSVTTNGPRLEILIPRLMEASSESNNYSTESTIDSSSEIENSALNKILPWTLNQSESVVSANIPNFDILNKKTDEINANIPRISELISESVELQSDLLPSFTKLQLEDNKSPPSTDENINNGIPDFNILRATNSIQMSLSTSLLPGTLNVNSNNSSNNTSSHLSSDPSKNTNTTSRPCTSPLPNLSLNTVLPHFSYTELETATNNFDSELFTTLDEKGRFLGSGAFGSVYLANGLLDKPIAVKKLVLDNVEVVNVDDRVTKQFRNEVEVLSKYTHKNLLSLLGYSCDGSTYCLMYEYVPGGSLKDRLQNNNPKLTWKERLFVAVGTARAISYLHTAFDKPLIHRDVKSANILLDLENKPKLCDFGLITLTPNQNTKSGTSIFGTSAYMSPEAFRGDISVKLDTFSFGVVLLELLTSLAPMDDEREGCDLVTHIKDLDLETIRTILDTQDVGTWMIEDFDLAEELHKLSLLCIGEKRNRPFMVDVTKRLDELYVKSLS